MIIWTDLSEKRPGRGKWGRDEAAFSLGITTKALGNEIRVLEIQLKSESLFKSEESLLDELRLRDDENLKMLFDRVKTRNGSDYIVRTEDLKQEKQAMLDEMTRGGRAIRSLGAGAFEFYIHQILPSVPDLSFMKR